MEGSEEKGGEETVVEHAERIMPYVVDFQKCPVCNEHHDFIYERMSNAIGRYPFKCPTNGKDGVVIPCKAGQKCPADFESTPPTLQVKTGDQIK